MLIDLQRCPQWSYATVDIKRDTVAALVEMV